MPTTEDFGLAFPSWLLNLRHREVVTKIQSSVDTQGDYILGIHRDEVFGDVLGGGQADFDAPYRHLEGPDRALLYAYLIQRGHLEELVEAFTQLFKDGAPDEPLIVLDLGCGPFTAGLALAAALGNDSTFSYIGLDRSVAMRELGEKLAAAAEELGALQGVDRQWVENLESVQWKEVPRWRSVLVIASYLLASPTLDVGTLVEDIDRLCNQFGRGSVTVLYTNSTSPSANQKFGPFRDALASADFRIFADDRGAISINDLKGARERKLRYALFRRDVRSTLDIQGLQ